MEQKEIDELLEKMEEEVDEVRENCLYDKEAILEEYAKMGIAEAIYQLAELEWYELDARRGAELYEQAAEMGHPKALWKMGIVNETPLLSDGYEDNHMARYYYEEAIKAGCTEACYELGNMYNNGIEVEQDKRKAFQLFKKAAACNEPRALEMLSVYYANGIVVEKDMETAYKLAHKAYIELNNKG